MKKPTKAINKFNKIYPKRKHFWEPNIWRDETGVRAITWGVDYGDETDFNKSHYSGFGCIAQCPKCYKKIYYGILPIKHWKKLVKKKGWEVCRRCKRKK